MDEASSSRPSIGTASGFTATDDAAVAIASGASATAGATSGNSAGSGSKASLLTSGDGSSQGSPLASSSRPHSNPSPGSDDTHRPPHGAPHANWQAQLTTVKERFAFLFNNTILSDVQFVVGRGDDEQNIPAHKFVLAVGSSVFDTMFNGHLASRQQVIHLPDVEPQAFLALLSFLYSDEVQIGPHSVMTVLYTAKKYDVPALERHCVEFLKVHLSPDNAFMLLTQARLFDEPQLAALCLKTIDKSTAEALAAEGFTDIDHATLSLVLQRDTLRIKELHLYEAVCRWAEAECQRQGAPPLDAPRPHNAPPRPNDRRAALGAALKMIRFPLMTVEEFAHGPAQSGILTDAEVVQLFLYFSVNPKPPVAFIDVPRCCMTGKEQTVCRFGAHEERWGYSGTPDRIKFTVDRRIFVVGFGLYGSLHGPAEFEVTAQLILTQSGKVCASNETVFTSDGTSNTFRVMFPEPVEVHPGVSYTAYATLKGPDSYYGTKGLRKVVVECPSGDRVSFQFNYCGGNNNGTSIEDGQLPEIIFYT